MHIFAYEALLKTIVKKHDSSVRSQSFAVENGNYRTCPVDSR